MSSSLNCTVREYALMEPYHRWKKPSEHPHKKTLAIIALDVQYE